MRERIAQYVTRERIGAGGMAEIFAGELIGAEGFVRDVAIKRIRPELSGDPGFGRLFVREARLASLLCHPNIAAVLDFDRDPDGHYFLVMERVWGVTLHDLINAGSVSPIPLDIAVFITVEILRALSYAHEFSLDGSPLGIVHRDISPDNVMISWDGAVKLVDFGVARALASTRASLTGSSLRCARTTRGKPSYMSPEQALGMTIDGRADVFSTGILMYEVLTGTRLFGAPTPEACIHLLMRKKIPSPCALQSDIPPDIASVCLRMLVRDRNARFIGARAALCALMRCADVGSNTTPDPSERVRNLLRERFSQRARPRATTPPLLLNKDTVPLMPSLVIHSHQRADAPTVMAPTRTAPPADIQRVRTHAHTRARLWIGGAVTLSLTIIGLALFLARVFR